jgi:hypothetical protein
MLLFCILIIIIIIIIKAIISISSRNSSSDTNIFAWTKRFILAIFLTKMYNYDIITAPYELFAFWW